MFFKPNDKIDEVTKKVAVAIINGRFNFDRYRQEGNRFHGVELLACYIDGGIVKPDVDVVRVIDADGKTRHTVSVRNGNRKNVIVDGEKYEEILRADFEESRKLRAEKIKPMIDMVRARIQEIVDRIDAEEIFGPKTANLLEYAANPSMTAIGAAYSYNRGGLAMLLADRIEDYAMRCVEGNGVYTLKQVCEFIESGKM